VLAQAGPDLDVEPVPEDAVHLTGPSQPPGFQLQIGHRIQTPNCRRARTGLGHHEDEPSDRAQSLNGGPEDARDLR